MKNINTVFALSLLSASTLAIVGCGTTSQPSESAQTAQASTTATSTANQMASKTLNVTTQPPYIVLTDNLDEPNGYGFCIDTYGRGQSDLLQTHTCKPYKENDDGGGDDVRFKYNQETKQIASYAYEGQCMQALVATGRTEFALIDCSDSPRQRFDYNETDKTIRLEEDPERCIAVDSVTQPAGPWVKRPLKLETCDITADALKQWTIVAE